MPKGDKSIATEAVLQAVDMIQDAKEEIRKSYGLAMGYEEMSRKEMKALIRKGITGDAEARDEVNKLHQVNQYPDGRNPVADEINLILAEHQEKIMARIGEMSEPKETRNIEDILDEQPTGQKTIEEILENV